jgi:hypothetical protein
MSGIKCDCVGSGMVEKDGIKLWQRTIVLCTTSLIVTYHADATASTNEDFGMQVMQHLAGPKHCKECPLYHE